MCAVPARAAGVERIVVVTPPGGSGLVAAAAELLGVDEVWAVGGPHAIAALAYGTETIAPRRQDRRAGQRVRERGEAASSRATSRSTCRPVRPRSSSCSAAAAIRASPSSSSPRRPSTGATRSAGSSKATTSRPRSRRWSASRRSTSSCSATPKRSRRAFATRARCSSATSSPVASGDYATGGNHVLPTGRLGALRRRARARDVPQARHGAAAHACGSRPRAADGRGARRRRGHARARRGGAAMKAARAELPAVPAGRRRRVELARRAGIDPVELVRFDGNVPPLPLPSSRPGDGRRGARDGERVSARAVPGAHRRDRRRTPASRRRTSCSARAPTT